MAIQDDSAALDRAAKAFRRHGGILRTMQAIRLGIHPRTLYAMRDRGDIEQLARGLYRLTDLPPLGTPDLVTVAKRVPSGVICLISALSFHELTTEIPHEVHLAVGRGAQAPRLQHPPIRVYRFGERALREGVERHKVDGIDVKVYSPAKTIADCFKFRNVVGMDACIDALKQYLKSGNGNVDKLMRYATVCRAAALIRPYVEALL